MGVGNVARDLAVIGPAAVRDAWRWRRAAPGPLVTEGTEVIDPVLDAATCRRIIAWADAVLASDEDFYGPDSWCVRRGFGGARDTQVQQLFNANLVNEDLAALAASGRVEALFAERLPWPLRLESVTVQVDDPDTETKRGWHVDRMTPPTFKLFVYLTDVDGPQHGPYTVLPGTHRLVTRKLANVAVNALRGENRTDMERWHTDAGAQRFLGPAGTSILSVQSIVHKGWPEHRERRRYMVVAYLNLASQPDKPFALGRDIAEARARSRRPTTAT